MREIVIATGNPHKVLELRPILAGIGFRVIGLSDLDGADAFEEPQETGTTFLQNATIKAQGYARQTGRICLADDSGLEVDALGGAPGVISSHYSTDGQETGLTRAMRDVANNARLIRQLTSVRPDLRTARFRCVMVMAAPPTAEHPQGRILATGEGTFEGRIGIPPDVPRGANGFGYDPLFLLPKPDTRASAELEPDEKNARSHRGAAARDLARSLSNTQVDLPVE